MDTDLLESLIPLFREETPLNIKKGQVIIRPEDKLDYIYFIEKGLVRFYHLNEDGKELTFLVLKPGYLFPIVYTFLGQNTRYYFEAMTPLVLRRTTRENFTSKILGDSRLIYLMTREIIKRSEEAMEKLQLISYGNASKIVAFIIKKFADEMGRRVGKALSIEYPLTHQEIASMAGLARETVTIEMKKLREKGLIKYKRGSIIINNLAEFNEKTGLEF